MPRARLHLVLAAALLTLAVGCRGTDRQAPGAAESGDSGVPQALFGAYYYTWYYPDKWRREPAPDLPFLGPYDSHEPSVAASHVQWAKKAGLDFFVVSWLGPGSPSDRNLRETVLPQMRKGGIHLVVLYETALALGLEAGKPLDFDLDVGGGKRTGETFVQHFDALADTYLTDKSYLRLGGKPVIVVYLVRDMVHAAPYVRRVRERLRARGFDVFLIADTVYWDAPEALDWPMLQESFQSVTAYNMYYEDDLLRRVQAQFTATARVAAQHSLGFVPNVMPGYDDTRLRGTDRPVFARDNGEFYRKGWAVAAPFVTPQQPLLLVTTFNEWHEGTEIEPSSRYGETYLDLTRKLVEATRHGTPPR